MGEFKSCLRALGYDLPVAEEEGEEEPEFDAILAIVDPNKDGSVQLQDYMAFMIPKRQRMSNPMKMLKMPSKPSQVRGNTLPRRNCMPTLPKIWQIIALEK